MKKNGFTLVELVVVLGLLALMGIVIGTNMVNLQGKQKDKNFQEYKSKLESAACLYMDKSANLAKKRSCRNNPDPTKNESCKVTAQELIESALIDENLVDPRSGKNAKVSPDEQVYVTWENSEQICTLKE